MNKQENTNEPGNKDFDRAGSKKYLPKWLLPMVSFLALIWFLLRVIPKPSRALYPCQRVAFPLAAGFIAWILGLTAGLFIAWRKSNKTFRRLIVICSVGVAIAVSLIFSVIDTNTEVVREKRNFPIGVAKGIHPGRVVWVYNPDATGWDYHPSKQWWLEKKDEQIGHWWQDSHTNQTVVDSMISEAIQSVAGKQGDSAAWDSIFHHFNKTKGKGSIGYKHGEKIVIKANFATMNVLNKQHSPNFVDEKGNMTSGFNLVNTSPQMILGLLRQLINVVGVAQTDITVGDLSAFFPNHYWDKCHGEFPNVNYLSYNGELGRKKGEFSNTAIYWSTPAAEGKKQDYLPQCYSQAEYLINFACLKGHSSGITLCGKNHYGSLIRLPDPGRLGEGNYYNLHLSLPNNRSRSFPVWSPGMGLYRAIVDLMEHEHLGRKTLLYLIDGLYGGYYAEGLPRKWKSHPFGEGKNKDWPSSLFVSQDPVAIDSVGYDFLLEEWPDVVTGGFGPQGSLKGGEQDYLHEAALIGEPPSGTFYDSDHSGDEVRPVSLGVHEHWNNPVEKQYSRNLGIGKGIELVKIISPSSTEARKEIRKDKDVHAVTGASIRIWGAAQKKENVHLNPYISDETFMAPGAYLEELYSADSFFEAPCWDPKTEKLYFVSWGETKKLLRLDEPGKVTACIDDTENKIGINGTFLSNDNQLLTAQVFAHKIVSYSISQNGLQNPLALAHDSVWFQPNDLCQTHSGDIYFSDPQWDGDHSKSAVYHLSKDGKITKVVDDMLGPNGLIASRDGKTLYIADSIQKLWRSYPVRANGSLGKGKVFFTTESSKSDAPDGMTIDEAGNLYLTGLGGVRIVSPLGNLLWMICVPEKVSNVTFGGISGKTLFLTCNKKVYSLEIKSDW
jgi:sugar lactone lactonase YvrE